MTRAPRPQLCNILNTLLKGAFAVVILSTTQAFATGSYSMVVAPTRGTTNANGPGYVAPGPILSTLSPNDTIALAAGGVIVELETHIVWDTGFPGQILGTAQWKISGLTTAGCPNCGLDGLGFDNGVGAPIEPLGFSTGDYSFGAYFNRLRCMVSDREGGANNGFDPPCNIFDAADGPAF